MESFSFRITQEAPLEAIVELYQDAGWWQESPQARKAIPLMIRNSFCFILVQENSSQKIVGMGRALSDGCSDAYIQDVVILKSFRQKGLGAKLIQELTSYCQKKGLEWIGLIGEPGTKSFYEKLGFEELPSYIPMKWKKK